MALKLKLKKSAYDSLSAEVKKEYIADGDDFRLDVEDMEDTGALRRAKDRETQLRKDAEKDRDEANEKIEKLERGKAGDVVKLEKKYQDDAAAKDKLHGEVVSKKDTFIRSTLLDGAANGLASKLNPKQPKVFVPHIASRLDVDFTGDTPSLVIKDKDGKPSKLTMDDLHKEFVANKDFSGIIIGSQASGGAGTGNRKTPTGSAGTGENGSGDNKTPDLSRMNPRDYAAQIKQQKADQAAASGTGE